ncbi:MAG: polyprenol monophosphomannose synthase [Candidatus Bathyarchaeota archaeon]|nr:polyprenol monophosphomannose synthase [Candidatus Bathyarchaeota archaeon]
MRSAANRREKVSKGVLLSIIVPTYNERENISALIDRIESSLASLEFEIIIVDDNSPDRTAEFAEELNKAYGNIKVVKRDGKFGLSSAVLDGFERAGASILAVLDADLQHPPELLPKIYEKILSGYDIAIASRYVTGSAIGGWSLRRKIVSRAATGLAHMLLPKAREVSDVMSGFFILKREVIEKVVLDPVGYKILLEILARGTYNSVAEVPYVFGPRKSGRSHLGLREIWNYLIQIYRLVRPAG